MLPEFVEAAVVDRRNPSKFEPVSMATRYAECSAQLTGVYLYDWNVSS